MKPETYEFEDFVLAVTHPQPASSAWEHIKNFFLHPNLVEVEVVLRDGVDLPDPQRRAIVFDLRAEFGHMAVSARADFQRWAVTVWMEPEVYAKAGYDHVMEVVGQAVDHARPATCQA